MIKWAYFEKRPTTVRMTLLTFTLRPFNEIHGDVRPHSKG
jgi:hypothetical protein